MSETSAFLEATMARYRDAETALHNGDAAPRKAMWGRTDPVTLLGAAFERDRLGRDRTGLQPAPGEVLELHVVRA